MADWAGQAITGLLSGGFVAAVFGGIIGLRKQRREDRGNEVTVLQQTIKDFRQDRDRDHEEMAKLGRDIGDLKDKYTACLLASDRGKQENVYLRRENKELIERMQLLEGQVKELQRKSNPEM